MHAAQVVGHELPIVGAERTLVGRTERTLPGLLIVECCAALRGARSGPASAAATPFHRRGAPDKSQKI